MALFNVFLSGLSCRALGFKALSCRAWSAHGKHLRTDFLYSIIDVPGKMPGIYR